VTTPLLSSAELVDHLLNRIGELDASGPTLRSVLHVDPQARGVAIERDSERRDGRIRGPLHGVPVLLKDNIDTVDQPTTAGSLALTTSQPKVDAPIVTRLREAGAILLGKTNLSEWANFRSPHSTSGWSAVGGLTANPWMLDRSAGGSSSGSGAAIAAGFAPMAVGTETDGSIVCPSSLNGIVGIKPTVGLLPAQGIVPISHSQDTPGPMARSVHDAATLLDVLAGTDGLHAALCTEETATSGLTGLRIGVARSYFSGHPKTDQVVEAALGLLSAAGADIVDPADVPVLPAYDAGEDELAVLLTEIHHDLDAYLSTRTDGSPRTLAELISFNREYAEQELAWFGQEFFETAVQTSGLDDPDYLAARRRGLLAAGTDGIDATLQRHGVDLLIAPAYGPAWKSDLVGGDPRDVGSSCTAAPAVAGYPIVCVPGGLVQGLPVGIALLGAANSETTLIRAAHVLERALDLAASGALEPTFAPPQAG
jgi:amidase